VGAFAVQLAKWRGARAIGVASTGNLDFVRRLGADEVIDYTATRFEEVVKDVDVVLDTVSGDTEERSWEVLKPGGILVSTLKPPSQKSADAKGVRATMVSVLDAPDFPLREIATLLDSGTIETFVGQVFPLSEIRQAHELGERVHTRGKIVLRVD
jgi:NADPH:quinone reductase-like Zn-dependent oxidoreductase